MMWWSVRGLVAAWLVGCASTEEDMTLAEAECVLRGTNLTFLGDSQSRFCVYGLNAFLATGALRSEEFSDAHDGNLGAGPGSDDYDAFDTWNEMGLLKDAEAHRMHVVKTFEALGASVDFYFIQGVWWDASDSTRLASGGTVAERVRGDATLADLAARLDAGVVVYNMG